MHKQAERWPISMSKVSKYNNHNYNIIITMSISNSLDPKIEHQTYYEMTATDKLPLITESVTATRIDIHHTWEEPDQHAIRLTPGGSQVWQPFAKSLLHQNQSPTHGEFLALGFIPPPTTSLRQGVQFVEVVTGLLGLPDPIKTWHMVST
jgi:hypothetical protein